MRRIPDEQFLHITGLRIENALNNSEIKSLLAGCGYSEEKILAGKELHTQAVEKYNLQQRKKGGQISATEDLYGAWEAAKADYVRHVKFARIAFEHERNIWKALALSGKRGEAISVWLRQAALFYTNALASEYIKGKLLEVGITAEALTAAFEKVKTVEAKDAVQEMEKSESQLSTEEKSKVFAELNDWDSRFVKVARLALENDPQLLEALGIVIK